MKQAGSDEARARPSFGSRRLYRKALSRLSLRPRRGRDWR
ncbi:hypothetical protein AZ78_0384 [Lysobacter capsici AZ78]|uniref:Uncharacterized protein n=1 Tax=Lysobacter capsici AZ78 TaxID=1444315 RepID=A0A125U0K4_9GAMM|nr:hypothetical protein AZ78_0384 [Lysobacter capsici AZ78]